MVSPAELPRFDVRQEDLGEAMVVTVSGEVDAATVPAMRVGLENAAREMRPRYVVDLRRVTYLDSLGITVFVQAFDRVRAAGSTVTVACNATTAALLESLGLEAEIAITATRDEALSLDESQLKPPSNPELPVLDPSYRSALRKAREVIESGVVPTDDDELMRLRFALDDLPPTASADGQSSL
ncbi:MAG: hypothetical protein QOJ29_2226 [Thermoleophilaceae bacterium]|nr:hypothetical protein [Thermoleophilaceae bacterium]